MAMKWVFNAVPKGNSDVLSIMSAEHAAMARAFHKSIPSYEPTPLANLKARAEQLGIGGLFVKDESYRFGLNAFKALGGSYAMACYIAQQVGREVADCSFDYLTSDQTREDLGQVTFYTATDGNHGRGVAWSARQLGQRAVVRMPKGTTEVRRAAIEAQGAEVTIEDLNYDGCVRLAASQAQACENGVLVQDTSWEGYEQVPTWIMQGYSTLLAEALEQMRAQGIDRPTHVFAQAGVGSLAAAVVGYFVNQFPDNPPRFVVLESQAADCLYRSAAAGDGKPRIVEGDLSTIMAGLACGEPCTIAWDMLYNYADAFVSCTDDVTMQGMRMLAKPLEGTDDPSIVSGESGAVGMGTLAAIMLDDASAELREGLGLNETSQVLLLSTEGNTDPQRYREIVGV